MKNYVLIFDDCCFYEIVILCYFLKYTKQEVVFCSMDGKKITCMEGFTVDAEIPLHEVEAEDIKAFIIPGGLVDHVRSKGLLSLLQELKEKNTLIAAICAGVDLLEEAGVLKGIRSTHSDDVDCISDRNVITARANAYVDFAIEFAKEQELFEDENDMKETIEFWKYHKRM